MKKEPKTKDQRPTTIKVSDAVRAYNTLKDLNIMKLKKEDMFTVLKAANALKPVAKAFEDFAKDVQERLKPEGFAAVTEKAQKFDTLSDEEKREVNKAYADYNTAVNDCLLEEQEKEREVEQYRHLSQDALGELIASNDRLTVDTILLLQQVLA